MLHQVPCRAAKPETLQQQSNKSEKEVIRRQFVKPSGSQSNIPNGLSKVKNKIKEKFGCGSSN
jgi:phosphoenolpyruvate synthase/pyruvate phosphate dikinase